MRTGRSSLSEANLSTASCRTAVGRSVLKTNCCVSLLCLFTAFGGTATGHEVAAEAETVALSTKSLSLVFGKIADGQRWGVLHFGMRLRDANDAVALTSARTALKYKVTLGVPEPAAYSVLGSSGLEELNRFGGLAVQHADGSLSTELVLRRTAFVADAPSASHLVFQYRDAAHDFDVTQHFRALSDVDVVETWVELFHREPGAVRLSRMDSFALDLPRLADTYHVHHLTGQWASEAHLAENELKRGETLTLGARSGIRDAWEGVPGVMVSFGARAGERQGTVFGGVLCWSGIWAISARRAPDDALSLRAGYDPAFGAYVLDPGRTIELPKFAFSYSAHGKGALSRNFHDWARQWQMPNGRKERPVLLNSWEGAYFTFTEETLHGMMDGVAAMGGELFVLDDGWFGVGPYARDLDGTGRTGLGDWVVNPAKLPHGLAALAGEAKRRGLKFGLWVEPEMASVKSDFYMRHPDWVLREKARPLRTRTGREQVNLDLVNPAVRENLQGQLDALVADVGDLAYLKWDANANLLNLGCPSLDAAHQANFPFDYVKGLYELLGQLRARHPGLDIQSCASGGGRADYGFLRYADEFWGSDDTDARERVFIQWGESLFFPAQAIGAHVTKAPYGDLARVTPLKYRFDVAMSCRFGFELAPSDLSADEVAFARRCVADYKRLRPTIQQGDLYRLVSPYGHSYAALMHVRKSRREAVVFVYGLTRSNWSDYPPPLVLEGLDPARRYAVSEINLPQGRGVHSEAVGKVVTGEGLMTMGVPFALKGDYDSLVLVLSEPTAQNEKVCSAQEAVR